MGLRSHRTCVKASLRKGLGLVPFSHCPIPDHFWHLEMNPDVFGCRGYPSLVTHRAHGKLTVVSQGLAFWGRLLYADAFGRCSVRPTHSNLEKTPERNPSGLNITKITCFEKKKRTRKKNIDRHVSYHNKAIFYFRQGVYTLPTSGPNNQPTKIKRQNTFRNIRNIP